MTTLNIERCRELVARIKELEAQVDEAVEDNFGYCPDYPWFDALLSELQRTKSKLRGLQNE